MSSVQWFPNHMARGLEVMRARASRVHLLIECRDARIPISSANPLLDGLKGPQRLILYNKADLADPDCNRQLRNSGDAMLLDATSRRQMGQVFEHIKRIAREQALGDKNLMLMICGIPNVGKSTILNKLRSLGQNTNRKAAVTGDQAGVTRAISERVRLCSDPPVMMWDTPGVLVPRILDPIQGYRLALTGAMRDHEVGEYGIVEFGLAELARLGRQTSLKAAYGVETKSVEVLLEAMGKALPALIERSTGQVNATNALRLFLRDFRQGRFGHLTLDPL